MKTETLLVIDDDKSFLIGLTKILQNAGYQVLSANDGNLGIKLAIDHTPDLIISDIMMPPPNGEDVFNDLALRPETMAIPFLFLTARTGMDSMDKGFQLGADDYITKPFDKNRLIQRIGAILRRQEITKTSTELRLTLISNLWQGEAINAQKSKLVDEIARLIALRNNETEDHSRRVISLTLMLAQELGFNPDELEDIRTGALMHDVGKVGIPDRILLKPGPLTDNEREIMKTHASLGKSLLAPLHLSSSALFIVAHHHENWDGTGYPDGLKGEEIPLVARIFALADVWDALTSDRPYRNAWTEEKAKDYILEKAGKQFDPQLVELFVKVIC